MKSQSIINRPNQQYYPDDENICINGDIDLRVVTSRAADRLVVLIDRFRFVG